MQIEEELAAALQRGRDAQPAGDPRDVLTAVRSRVKRVRAVRVVANTAFAALVAVSVASAATAIANNLPDPADDIAPPQPTASAVPRISAAPAVTADGGFDLELPGATVLKHRVNPLLPPEPYATDFEYDDLGKGWSLGLYAAGEPLAEEFGTAGSGVSRVQALYLVDPGGAHYFVMEFSSSVHTIERWWPDRGEVAIQVRGPGVVELWVVNYEKRKIYKPSHGMSNWEFRGVAEDGRDIWWERVGGTVRIHMYDPEKRKFREENPFDLPTTDTGRRSPRTPGPSNPPQVPGFYFSKIGFIDHSWWGEGDGTVS